MPNLILGPDNYLLFIATIVISAVLAMHSYMSYTRTHLSYLIIGLYALCIIRACIEFGLQNTDSYAHAVTLYKYNGMVAHAFFALSWPLLYYYILPFKRFKSHRIIDAVLGIFLMLIPNIIILLWFYQQKAWTFYEQKIDGYWMFKAIPSALYNAYQVYTYIIMLMIFIYGLMIYSILSEKNNRLRKVLLLILFIAMTITSVTNVFGLQSGEWKAVAHAPIMLIDIVILSWFISDYRLIRDQFEDASNDIMNSISELMVRTDHAFNVLNMNNAAASTFGDSLRNLKAFYLNKDDNNSIDSLTKLVTSHSAKEQIAIQLGDQTKYLLARMSPYHWRGRELGYSFIFTDITELKNKEQELLEVNRTKDQLFSIISHDLRKPALAFRGITKKVNYLIQRREFDLLNKLGDSVEKSALQLNALLDNLLKWALTQKNAITIKNQPVIMKQIADELIRSFELITSEKRIDINVTGIAPDHILHTDGDILQTIMRNLVDNAIKYSESDSTIFISTNQEEHHLIISVKDRGIGMSQDQMDRLFELHHDKSTHGTYGEKGSGLGLNLVKELVDRSGGRISLESSYKIGTAVTITYPIYPKESSIAKT